MGTPDVVVLVPGFLGFARLGAFYYFAERLSAVLRSLLEEALDSPIPVVPCTADPAALPVDLVNFKASNPLFPQQPTTDPARLEAGLAGLVATGSTYLYQSTAEVAPWLASHDDVNALDLTGVTGPADVADHRPDLYAAEGAEP